MFMLQFTKTVLSHSRCESTAACKSAQTLSAATATYFSTKQHVYQTIEWRRDTHTRAEANIDKHNRTLPWPPTQFGEEGMKPLNGGHFIIWAAMMC